MSFGSHYRTGLVRRRCIFRDCFGPPYDLRIPRASKGAGGPGRPSQASHPRVLARCTSPTEVPPSRGPGGPRAGTPQPGQPESPLSPSTVPVHSRAVQLLTDDVRERRHDTRRGIVLGAKSKHAPTSARCTYHHHSIGRALASPAPSQPQAAATLVPYLPQTGAEHAVNRGKDGRMT